MQCWRKLKVFMYAYACTYCTLHTLVYFSGCGFSKCAFLCSVSYVCALAYIACGFLSNSGIIQ